MDIKEIAQRLAPGYWKRDQLNIEYFDSVGFSESLIESYKAELLKEAGGPVAYRFEGKAGEYGFTQAKYACNVKYAANPIALYTSDQVAAAILKATKPLEEEVERLKVRHSDAWVEIDKLRAQLVAAKEEIESNRTYFTTLLEEQRVLLSKAEQLWQIAQGRCDGLEEKLAKAEQRVAEAIADMFQQKHRNCFRVHSVYLAASVSIANGEWRKFVKEVRDG